MKLTLPKSLQKVSADLCRLPGIGKRTAERLAFAMLDWPDDVLANFGTTVAHLHELVKTCRVCGNFAEDELCPICANPQRRHDVICVVEHQAQISVIENSGCFNGLYHVLGGKLSPLSGRTPADLRFGELGERLATGEVTEVIIATSPDVEGEATANYLAAEFASYENVVFSRLALGLPAGADLNYADSATLAFALNGRRKL